MRLTFALWTVAPTFSVVVPQGAGGAGVVEGLVERGVVSGVGVLTDGGVEHGHVLSGVRRVARPVVEQFGRVGQVGGIVVHGGIRAVVDRIGCACVGSRL